MSYPDPTRGIYLTPGDSEGMMLITQMQPDSFADASPRNGRHTNQQLAVTREYAATLAAKLLHYAATGQVAPDY